MESKLLSESKDLLHGKQKQLEKDEKRIAELDRLFIRLYEDNVASLNFSFRRSESTQI